MIKTTFKISILLLFLLQGLFAIEGLSLCIHEDGSVNIEVADNCCEEESNTTALNIDCETCNDISFSCDLYPHTFNGKTTLTSSNASFLYQKTDVIFSNKFVNQYKEFPYNQYSYLQFNQLRVLKRVILII